MNIRLVLHSVAQQTILNSMQRPNAGTFVRFTPSDLDGYDHLRRYLENGPLHWPDRAKKTGPITISDCTRYGELSFAFDEIGSRWGGDDYVPGTRDAYGANMFNVPSYFEPLGSFDRDSIMMYQSRLHGRPVIQFITHRSDGQTTYEQICKWLNKCWSLLIFQLTISTHS